MGRNVRERNRRERLAVFGACVFGFWVFQTFGTVFLAIADGPCFEQPSVPIAAGVDPNKVAGHLIDVLDVAAGKVNRTGRYCDPGGWPVEIELIGAPDGWGVTVDPDAETWTIAGELGPGDWGIVARGRNVPRFGEPNEVIVTVYFRVRAPAVERPRLR